MWTLWCGKITEFCRIFGKWIFWFDPSFIKLAEYILLKTRLTIGFSAMFRTRKLRLMSRTRILISDRGVSCLMWDVSSATGVQFPTSATELNSRRYHRLISNTILRSSPSLDWYPLIVPKGEWIRYTVFFFSPRIKVIFLGCYRVVCVFFFEFLLSFV